MIRLPPRSTRTDTRFPYPPRFRARHGVGADGNDLIGIAPLWAQLLPGVAFVSPNAPEPCDMAPFGHQWFSLQDRRPAAMLAGVQAAAPVLDAFLDRELERHGLTRSEERRVGQECVSTCRSRWSPDH